jgi:hypothetical protein
LLKCMVEVADMAVVEDMVEGTLPVIWAGSGGARMARGGERGGHGHGGRSFGGGVGYACTPLQLAAGYCGYGY